MDHRLCRRPGCRLCFLDPPLPMLDHSQQGAKEVLA
jgi:hypothetical protein